MGKECGEGVSEEEDVDLMDEEEADDGKKGKRGGKDSRKRKASGEGGKLDSGKKGKSGGDANGVFNGFENALMTDASERFSTREAEKFPFLGRERNPSLWLGKSRKDRTRTAVIEKSRLNSYSIAPHLCDALNESSRAVFMNFIVCYVERQWWEFKSKHMDKVLFFKMGKFYELFEMDAHVGAKELDLQYMKGEQPRCGFPEKNFSLNVEKLARKGYRVLVVEQIETPEQLELRRKEKGSKDKVVKREICAVITKGTLTEGELLSANPDASYLMALTENRQSLANQGLERIFGVCVVDVTTSKIILGQFGDDAECSSLRCLLSELRPVEIVKPAKMLSSETERVMVRHTRNPSVNELATLSEFWDAEKTVQEVKTIYKHIGDLSASGPLNKTNLDTTNLNVGEYRPSCLPSILSEFVNKGENGSLALPALGGALYYLKQAFLDETLLIFVKFDSLPCSDFYEDAKKPYMILDAAALENLEIFENSRNVDTSGKEAASGVYICGCELVAQACSSLAVILENVESGRLLHLLTPGVDVEYDSACEKVKEVESSLATHLKEQQKLLGDTSITYVTVGKEAYLLELPEHLRGSIPQDYEPHSSKKGFYRYWTPSIKKFLGELSQVESEKESALKSILQRLIVLFCKYHDKWRQLVSATAELDVLISLAIASDCYEGPACRPIIGAFVPNDISIGGSGCASFILLSGPNMGGKSTLLRQVCLAVILAQIGADVPAESFELSPVDRIFARMGVKDHIMAG
ncbi:hypothetical protein D5086_005638 [Populus alba]|uniref:Uncharacterized protein n=1 Tax=Populus alba TaxID=43335 RepID=A0ACC4CTR9_POPAL